MSWVLFAVGAAFFWSLNIVFDKYVVDNEIEDYVVTTIFCSFSAFILLGLISYYKGVRLSDIGLIHLLLGGLYTLALMAYYSGIGREEVSRFAPTLAIDTVFISIFAFIFLGESFGVVTYLGVLLVVVGAFLISLDDPVHSLKTFQSKTGVKLAIIAALVFSVRDILFKFSLEGSSHWTVLFGASIGGLISIAILSIIKRKKILNSGDKGEEHLLFIGVLMALGYYSFISAINSGPVSLSSAVVKSQNLMIFFMTLLIERNHSEMIAEDMQKPIMVQKFVSVVLIILGLVMVQLF